MKTKVLLISDDIRAHSGVGTMARYIVEDTKEAFDWVQIGSLAIHPDKGKIVEHEGTRIYCAEGFGSIELIRKVIDAEGVSAVMLFTDPRFFGHVWKHEDEIRSRVPIFYYNIWDAGPAPLWNFPFWGSCDGLGAISRQTYALNAHVAPNVPRFYIPHGTDVHVYRPVPDDVSLSWMKKQIGYVPKFSVLYVNRNIRRKQTSDLVLAVHRLIEKTNDEDITLLLRTDAVDGDGTDIPAVLEGIGFRGRVVFFGAMEASEMANLYNAADVTVNIASNEGFGITTLESLACGTPILVNMTGGLQDQVGLKKDNGFPVTLADYTPEWYTNADGRYTRTGIHADVVFPKVRTINGSPVTPYVLAEYAQVEDVTEKLLKVYGETREDRKIRGAAGRHFVVEAGMTRQAMARRIARALQETIDNFEPRARYEVVNTSSHPYRVDHGHVTETRKEAR